MSVFNQSRSNIIRLIFLGLFLIIIVQLFNLQVIQGKYKVLAMENAVFAKVKYPDRGIIYDRKNRPILNNTIMYDLVVVPNEARKNDTLGLCEILNIDTAEYNKRIREAVIKNGRYRPSIFEDLLEPQLQARLDENIWKFPGFALVERPVRVYPFNAAAHIMGYIGEADSNIIKRSSGFYHMGDYVGRSGLEAYYERVLMGQRGVEFLLKDNKNRLVGNYEKGRYDTPAVRGRNLHTYIDIELQQLAEKLINGKLGAVVALDPKTGGILAMASGPNYDPNTLTGPNKQKNYGRMVLDVKAPLLNRAIQGFYPPGSTYKPLGALIGLDEGVITPASGISCTGAYYGCNKVVRCTEHWQGHSANLRLSIAWSCNSFFSDVFRKTIDNPAYHSSRTGLVKWTEYMNRFGLGHRIGIDLPSEIGGNVPDTTQYDKEYRRSWNSCTMVTIGIGQDKLTVTPLQMANSMAIVANKGYYYIPHFVKNFENENEQDTVMKKYREKHEVLTHIPEDQFDIVQEGMQDVVEHGTAQVARIPGINMCAKTGTAENKTVLDGRVIQLKDNSMFVCFAPREDPKICVAVVVQNAGFGATWAAPIGSLLVEKYLTDSLRTERVAEVKRISEANIIPDYFERLQYKTDSIRARKWFDLTKDSNYIRKYLPRQRVNTNSARKQTQSPAAPVAMKPAKDVMINENLYAKRSTTDKRNP
ncbi:penicillin-binding protein 2 [Niastella koreensis]|uniref:Peptidoglycan glycosyltransferase n=2 Tax=Niastella koreensis TaxID=354356 RepID=G8TMS6_NIAKG|nr:penicillin-binding protein 2 [Niastella koreensis]AEW03097.1 peptidoglycan glycosyltransferase [Niastella koreensis GR20-10]OQP55410.1 penicillin-binding protein 2 [Niastella koreensis]